MVLHGACLLRGTTMLAACMWASVSLIAVGGSELGWAWNGASSVESLNAVRFACYMTCFCPCMALLGAKRPQNRAWQFIVLSLWLVLIMPALEAWAFHRDGYLQVRDARGLFLWILIFVGLLNVVATRYFVAGICAAGGQIALLVEYLPGLRSVVAGSHGLLAMLLFLIAIGLVYFHVPKRKPRVAVLPEDRLWLDFRDMYGVVWALRIAERVNALAEQHGWCVRLHWSGFERLQETDRPDSIDESTRTSVRKTIRMLLRRFVSTDWINQRYTDLRLD